MFVFICPCSDLFYLAKTLISPSQTYFAQDSACWTVPQSLPWATVLSSHQGGRVSELLGGHLAVCHGQATTDVHTVQHVKFTLTSETFGVFIYHFWGRLLVSVSVPLILFAVCFPKYFWEYYFMKCYFKNWTSEVVEGKKFLQCHLPETCFQDTVQFVFFVPPENMNCSVSNGEKDFAASVVCAELKC